MGLKVSVEEFIIVIFIRIIWVYFVDNYVVFIEIFYYIFVMLYV